jgi:hypothetical protein
MLRFLTVAVTPFLVADDNGDADGNGDGDDTVDIIVVVGVISLLFEMDLIVPSLV